MIYKVYFRPLGALGISAFTCRLASSDCFQYFKELSKTWRADVRFTPNLLSISHCVSYFQH